MRPRSRGCRRCRSPDVAVRAIQGADLEALDRDLPVWNATEYAHRLAAQGRRELVQAVAWLAGLPVGRGMVLFPDHEEYSESALRERCAEVRDVFVAPVHRRSGVASEIMAILEGAARERMERIGLSVSRSEDAAPARSLYARLGYRHAHGPYLTSASLTGEDGPFPVGAVLDYLVKDL
jgi:GNAT superfamily N-acetyltransferase